MLYNKKKQKKIIKRYKEAKLRVRDGSKNS